MISRENVIREVLSDLEAQRALNLAEEKRRKEEAIGKSAIIQELLDRRKKLFFLGIRKAFSDPNGAKNVSEQMENEIVSFIYVI